MLVPRRPNALGKRGGGGGPGAGSCTRKGRVSTPCWPLGNAQVSRCDPKAAAKVAALGLLQPLEALSLDADTLLTATVAAVAYCDAQGAGSVADLVERASTLITVAGLGSVA